MGTIEPVSVTTFVERGAFTHPIHGVGVLMPAREETESLGMLFNSSSFGYRVSDQERFASFTVMMGGAAHPEWLEASDTEIQQAIKLELSALLGIRESHRIVNQSLARRLCHNTRLTCRRPVRKPATVGASSPAGCYSVTTPVRSACA
jgi:protoporphyrinogen oxidase